MPPHRHAYRPAVMGNRGVVTSAHPLASMAGIRVLLDGGNAVDAAVAVAAALNVVEPFMSSAGGIGLMLISRAKGRERHVLDFIGRAPAASDASRATEDELAGGPKSCATPGNLGGWLAALERFGSMPRSRVRPRHRARRERRPALVDERAVLRASAGGARSVRRGEASVSRPGSPRPGKVVTYKELAGTFRQVAEGGAEAFYRGSIARAIARAVTEAGGWLSEADLAAFTPEWREPLSITYRGVEVCSVPPPFSAFQMLETLNILEGFDVAGWGHNSVEYLHHLIEAIKLASADRLAYAYSARRTDPWARVQGLCRVAAQADRPGRAGVSEGERFDAARLPSQIREGHPAEFCTSRRPTSRAPTPRGRWSP